jgi:hypothetical protein
MLNSYYFSSARLTPKRFAGFLCLSSPAAWAGIIPADETDFAVCKPGLRRREYRTAREPAAENLDVKQSQNWVVTQFEI